MTRREQIEELREKALLLGPKERRAYLDSSDPALAHEVEELLNAEAAADATLTMAGALTRLGPYEIEAPIGKGGMGEVFRAVDTRLGRKVAIKTSNRQFDARFEREARAISSVNHPHICTLYDVGPNYLVMELVEGETLAARLKRGKLSIEETLRYGAQIADALAEAHSKGITHRDLKPGNVMLGRNGVKVLDFGLAKLHEHPDESLTQTNAVMGTPAYMAPEQLEGKKCDARTDIYALGLVLHEMATGRRYALGTDLSGLRSELPEGLSAVIGGCLVKAREGRFQGAAEVRDELVAIQTTPATVTVEAPARGTRFLWMGAAALLLGGVAAGIVVYLRMPAPLSAAGTLVLANFSNSTGDAVFDDALRQGLLGQFAQSPFLVVLPEARVQQTLRLMGRDPGDALTPQVAREVCERSESSAVIEGSIAGLGSQYVLGLKAIACPTGETLGAEQGQANSKEQVLVTLGTLASQLRVRLGESLATVNAHSTPIPQATTGSLEALRAYAAGMKANLTGDPAAVELYKRAVELDPQFGSAYASLGLVYSGTAQPELSREATIKAYELRDRMIEPERYFVTLLYDREVTGNLEKALQTAQTWAAAYPRDFMASGLLAGYSSQGTARYEITIDAARKARFLNPNSTFPYSSEGVSYLRLNRLEEAEKSIQEASDRMLDGPDLSILRFDLAYLKNDQAGMDQELERSRGKVTREDLITLSQGLVYAGRGQMRLATERFQRAADLARNAGQIERAASFVGAIAMTNALYERPAEVRAAVEVALRVPRKGRDIEFAAAFPLALIGEWGRAESFADDLEKRFPEDTSVHGSYLPALLGLVEIRKNNAEEALRILQAALSTELYIPGLSFDSRYGIMLPTYVRGLAAMKLQRFGEAAAEFQKIADHRGVVGIDPIGSFARLELARAYAQAGDRARAKAGYQEVLELWKNADSGLALVERARMEAGGVRGVQ